MNNPDLKTFSYDGYAFSVVIDGNDIHIAALPDLSAYQWDMEGLIRYQNAITQFINEIQILKHNLKTPV